MPHNLCKAQQYIVLRQTDYWLVGIQHLQQMELQLQILTLSSILEKLLHFLLVPY